MAKKKVNAEEKLGKSFGTAIVEIINTMASPMQKKDFLYGLTRELVNEYVEKFNSED